MFCHCVLPTDNQCERWVAREKAGSWGAILRDENGLVLLSAYGKKHCPNAEYAEAIVSVYNGPVWLENDCAFDHQRAERPKWLQIFYCRRRYC